MAKNDYAYAVARIRVRELSLLSSSFLEQLVSAADYETCLKLLREKGSGKKRRKARRRCFRWSGKGSGI